jgi:hypothetical protein
VGVWQRPQEWERLVDEEGGPEEGGPLSEDEEEGAGPLVGGSPEEGSEVAGAPEEGASEEGSAPEVSPEEVAPDEAGPPLEGSSDAEEERSAVEVAPEEGAAEVGPLTALDEPCETAWDPPPSAWPEAVPSTQRSSTHTWPWSQSVSLSQVRTQVPPSRTSPEPHGTHAAPSQQEPNARATSNRELRVPMPSPPRDLANSTRDPGEEGGPTTKLSR